LILRRRRKKKKEEEEEEDTLPSSADFKLHIGYTRDSRIINLLHRSLLKEDLDIEKKEEKEGRTRTRRYFAKLCRFQTPHWVHKRQQDHQPSSQILIERRP
jgi:hypothetical protein